MWVQAARCECRLLCGCRLLGECRLLGRCRHNLHNLSIIYVTKHAQIFQFIDKTINNLQTLEKIWNQKVLLTNLFFIIIQVRLLHKQYKFHIISFLYCLLECCTIFLRLQNIVLNSSSRETCLVGPCAIQHLVKGKQLSADIRSRIISKQEAGIRYTNRCDQLNVSKHLADEDVDVSLSTVSNSLHEAELHGRRPSKTPLLRDVHLL